MRRIAAAVRPILRCFAAGLSWLGAAQAETVSLHYELSVAGIGVADMAVSAQLDGEDYAVQARGETYGAASMFDDLKIDARVSGRVADGSVTPQAFGADNVLNGRQRHARVAWSPDGEATTQDLQPSLADEKRTPIPDDARMGALDPMTALLGFALGGPASGACSGSAKVFDGRRSYTLDLFSDPEGLTYVKRRIGDADVIALKCAIRSRRTGGASPSSWFSGSGESESAKIWFWRDPKGRAIPIRVEADAAIGYGIGELARLPD